MDHLRADARLLASADQVSSAADQTLSDTDQSLSDSDQALAEQDQRAADEEQQLADSVHGPRPSLPGHDESAYERSRMNRTARSNAREAIRRARLRSASERNGAAGQRDRIAQLRDGIPNTTGLPSETRPGGSTPPSDQSQSPILGSPRRSN